MGLTVLLLHFASPRPAPEKARATAAFMTVWLCVVLASFTSSVLWSAGTILATWPPPRAAMLFSNVESAMLSAGYWGIIWGWIPARVWTLMARRRPSIGWPSMGDISVVEHVGRQPRDAPGRTARPTARTLLLGATAACGVLLVAAAPLSGAASRAANAAQVRPAPSPTPSEPPVVYGSPMVGPSLQAPDPAWCRGEQVTVSLGEPDAATGHRGMPIRLVNTGGSPCVLNSYPDIAFNDTAGWAMAGAGDTRVGPVLVAPFSGTARSGLAMGLDMVNGGYVAVTAWSLPKSAG
jgi:hypothetical protein